jgi:hypothetical protein
MGIVENMKDAADLAKKVGDIELYRKIVHLEGEVIELTREKRQAEQKIEELESKLALTGEVFRERGFAYRVGDREACCSRCWDADRKLIHIVEMFIDKRGRVAGCPQCKTSSVYPPPNPRLQT